MKKGKFKGAILACSLLAFGAIVTTTTFGLTSCGGEEQKPVENNFLTGVTAFEIANKEEFDFSKEGYAWYPGDADKEIKLNFTGAEVNLLKAFKNKQIEITSSDPEIASVINNYVAPRKAGEVTLTLTVHTDKTELKQELKVKVLAKVEQPETATTTVKELLAADYDAWAAARPQQDYTVKGKVVGYKSVGAAPDKYGNLTIQDLTDPSKQIVVYGSTKSTKAFEFFPNGTWKFSNPKDFLDKDNNPAVKVGEIVTLHAIMSSPYGGKNQIVGIITNTETGEGGGETGGETVEDPIKNAKAISVADLAKKTEPESTQLYTVTGVVTSANKGDKYGNITITDKATGASVSSWGTAKDATCWTFNKDGVAIAFTNPQDFSTECLGKKFNLGDEVKFNVYVAPKAYGKPGVDLNFQFVEKVTESSKLKYGVSFEGEAAKYFEALTKTEYVFGEDVVLTPKAGTVPEGKELKVTVGEQVIGANAEGKYVFAASVVNKVTVTLADAGSVADVVITPNNFQLTGSYTEFDEKDGFIDVNGLQFDYSWLMKGNQGGDCIQMNKKDVKEPKATHGSSLWVAAPAEKEIAKVVIKGVGDAWSKPAGGAVLFTTFSTTAADHSIADIADEAKIPTELNAIKSQFTATEKVFTIASNVEGAKTFAISHLAKSGATYIDSIEVFYK